MSLRQLQREFAANLTAETVQFSGALSADGKLPFENLVSVYRNNSRASLRTALATVYPVIQKLVGPEFFDYLADRYSRDYPLRRGDLRSFGQHLPEFLNDFEPVSTLPYAVDVARIERAYRDVSRAVPIAVAWSLFSRSSVVNQLGALRFKLAPACRLVRSRYPVFSIWKANQEEYSGDQSISLGEGPQSVLLVRLAAEVELRSLQSTDAEFVQGLACGATLGTVVEQMMSAGHSFNLEALLCNFVRSGCLVLDIQGSDNVGGLA